MEEKLLETIVSGLTNELINKSGEIFNEINDEIKQFINTGLKKYLDKQKNKYSHIKTLLRGNSPVYLYDIYYPIKITQKNRTIDTRSVNNVFSASNFVTIIGDAGSGKSTLVKHLFLNSIQEKIGIPILIELRYLNNYNNSFEEYIYEKIFENKLSTNSNILERLLQKGKFVLFLDGYDELNADTKQKVIQGLNSFINMYTSNKFILTSRPYSDIEHLPLFHNYKVKSLSFENGEIEGFIHKQLATETELALKIVTSLKNNYNHYIGSFLTNPLLLSLYILTFQRDASIPSKKYIFYRRVVNALFSEHDSKTKLGFVREKLCNLNQEQYEEILKAYCFLTYFDSKFDWDIDYATTTLKHIKEKTNNIAFDSIEFINDLKSAIALWIEDNGVISFAHRSLQEYFAALFIKNLNSADNRRLYGKIKSRFSDVRNLNEIENFLSLCEEMDENNFIKYYANPLLKELLTKLDTTDERSLMKSFICFFSTGIDSQSSPNFEGIVINQNIVYKTIYLHINFTRRLYQYIRDAYRNYIDTSPNQNEIQQVISFKRDNMDFLFEYNYKELYSICKEYHNYLINKIKENEKFIEDSNNFDKSLVDLI